ncbi:glycosyltransferase family 4 protein [Nesterenkonia sandarakina]|uniref:Glycosyltransferase involved in cell wall biosynthesis n=1 Tax=Nesterenkonia sandarakina TaxID=272918 RepID=A0A2T0YA57_9MICC|nr:glycosyltransferase involved in cell wall biosynthesis [Nesterenkonia sandarakina]
MKLALITESQSSNSLGRTHCLWMLAQQLGWDAEVFTTEGEKFWYPLSGTAFETATTRVGPSQLADAIPADTELLIACKPLPASLGRTIPIAKARNLPLLVDIDDPDLEARLRVGEPLTQILRWLRRPARSIVDTRHRQLARSLPSLVSNPWLQARYGGTIVPHVRPVPGLQTYRAGEHLDIVFVGTNHAHKGTAILREAVGLLQADGPTTTLTVTDVAPVDAQPWERWVGRTTLQRGTEIVGEADLVVLPSLDDRRARGQLPAKLVDAMMLGRPVIVSDVAPMPWACHGGGLVVPPGDVEALARAIRQMRSPDARRTMGEQGRERALKQFSVSAVAERFKIACQEAVAGAS